MSKKSGASKKAAGPDQALPVYSLPHDEQVDLLAQALLREYMHKKGFKGTLAAFDEENPRDERTISSRSVMGDLMALDKQRQEEMKVRGVDTIMEALCYTRAEKRERALGIAAAKKRLLEGDLAPQTISAAHKDAESEVPKKTKKAKKSDKSHKKEKGAIGLSIDELLDQDTPLTGKGKRRKRSPEVKPSDIVVIRKDVEWEISQTCTSNLRRAKREGAKRNVQFGDIKVTVYDPHDDNAPPEEDPAIAAKTTLDLLSSKPVPMNRLAPLSTAALTNVVVAEEVSSEGDSSPSGSDDSAPSGDGDYEGVVARTQDEEDRLLRERHMRREGSGGNLKPRAAWGASPTPERRGSVEASHTPSPRSSASSVPSPQATSPSASPSSSLAAAPKPNSLGEKLASDLMVLLVGGDRRIPTSFMNQGFYFNDTPEELQFGLLQNEGGCCGVLAAVQAFLLARFIGNHFIITRDVQRSFLVSALVDILLIGQPDLARIQLVSAHPSTHPPTWDPKGTLTEQRRLLANQLVLATGFTTRADLEEAVGSLVPHSAFGGSQRVQGPSSWCEPRGYGLLCFLLTCVLSHGLREVSSDMDVQSPIIVEYGYCSQELVNLLVCGRATSNVHDGVVSHGSMDLKGFCVPDYHPSIRERTGDSLMIGFLSAHETKGAVEVGSLGKYPAYPVWIIHNESHYTVAWLMKDVRDAMTRASPTSESPTVDVHYYDQHGGQDEDIRLTLTLDEMPLPAVHRDALVPYLNPILRTVPEWALAKIGWNGTDPLL